MKIVEAQEAREKLTMPVCIDLMRTALKELEEGNWTQPVRSIAVLPAAVYQKELALLLIQASPHPLLIAFRN